MSAADTAKDLGVTVELLFSDHIDICCQFDDLFRSMSCALLCLRFSPVALTTVTLACTVFLLHACRLQALLLRAAVQLITRVRSSHVYLFKSFKIIRGPGRKKSTQSKVCRATSSNFYIHKNINSIKRRAVSPRQLISHRLQASNDDDPGWRQ